LAKRRLRRRVLVPNQYTLGNEELRNEEAEIFKVYLRMNPQLFDLLLQEKIKLGISLQNTVMRKTIGTFRNKVRTLFYRFVPI